MQAHELVWKWSQPNAVRQLTFQQRVTVAERAVETGSLDEPTACDRVSGKGGVEGELTASILERAGEVAGVKAGLEAVAESNGNTGHDGGVDGDREGPKEAVRGALEVSWRRSR